MNIENYDVVIIGAGPAGMCAAIYAKRAGLNVALLEKNYPGGQIVITDEIENYPGFFEKISGYELANKLLRHCQKFGIEPQITVIQKIELSKKFAGHKIYTENVIYETKSIIFCNGANPRKLNISGEAEFTGRGVSYCATCDAAFFKNKKVAVIGGGDSALEEALYLTKFVDKLFLIHRRDKFRALKIIVDKVMANPKIELVLETIPLKIIGEKNVKGLTLKNVKTEKITELAIDGVFIFAGYIANTEIIPQEIEKDENGYIVVDKKQQTNIKGVFAAGDICSKFLRQVITACSDGAIAAIAAMHYIDSV
ncbi:MAG TPA: thioredoxin-disulfide reductase [bacterium]|nr:thioredoxin-disulfide reductase [bacterium]